MDWSLGPSGEYMSDTSVHGEAHIKPSKTTEYSNAHDLYPLALLLAFLRAEEKK